MGSMLFSPIAMRSTRFANRIMVSPMGQCSAKDGCATPWHVMHLGSLAVSGAAALTIEATAVSPTARNTPVDLGLWSDRHAEALLPAIEFCREHSNAKLGLQLWHAGRKGSVQPAWDGNRLIMQSEGGWHPFAPSAVPYPGRHVPHAMSLADIGRTIDDYRAAARRAASLALDYVEIHAAHGYLLHNFLSPLVNQRDDDYGGSLDNRCRFVLEVFDAVRGEWPDDRPLGVRISATDWIEGGWTLDDSIALVSALKTRGCDYVTASSGGTLPVQKIHIFPGYQVPLAEAIRAGTGMTTIAVGLITEPRQAEDILQSGKADMVALARGMLYNPRWPWHAAIELGDEPSFPRQYERAHPAMRGTDFLKARRD